MDNTLFLAHQTLICTRWPTLWEQLAQADLASLQVQVLEGLDTTLTIQGIQLTSRHNRMAEANAILKTLPHFTGFYLYGTGLGELPQLLLQRQSLQHLHIKLLNTTLFALLLHVVDMRPWLADPRVDLSQAKDDADIHAPFFALPSELELAEDHAVHIRERLWGEIHIKISNLRSDDHAVEEKYKVKNFNATILKRNKPLFIKDPPVETLFNTFQDRSAYVIATGPTLSGHLPLLQQIWQQADRPLFIAVDTALKPLLKYGIYPDLVVTLDHAINQRYLPIEESAQLTLVYFPISHTTIIQQWQGKKYTALTHSPLFAKFPHRGRIPLYSGGSVIHPTVDLTVKLGVKEITLFGADFAFIDGQTHGGWNTDELAKTSINNGIISTNKVWLFNGHGNKVTTQTNYANYLFMLERYIAKHPEITFYNTSKEGAMIKGCQWSPLLFPGEQHA